MDMRNNLFGRGPRPAQPPQPQYRPPRDGYTATSQQRPPPQNHYGGPSRPDASNGIIPPGMGAQVDFLRVDKLQSFQDQNICTVPQEFCNKNGIQAARFNVIVSGKYHVTAQRHEGFGDPQAICLIREHRDWMNLRRPPGPGEAPPDRDMRDRVTVQHDPSPPRALTRAYVSVKWAKQSLEKTPPQGLKNIPQEWLADIFRQSFNGTLLAPGQRNILKGILTKGQPTPIELELSCKIESITFDATDSKNPEDYGILDRSMSPQIDFYKDPSSNVVLFPTDPRAPSKVIIRPDFNLADLGIGGLDDEFGTIFRRAFASRAYHPSIIEKMGIGHVRGILLHGPPGTGKTLIAREIGQMLNAKPPKIINGPEILNKYVGQSEENIRKVFADAEKDQRDNQAESDLHIIIFDELDAVCKQRGSGGGGGTGVGDSVVNQLLTKLDGVEQLNNILLIGMTNRKDMIDDALLRPGRLEVHVEISLPDERGRQQIFMVHTKKMRESDTISPDVDIEELAALTKNFSGAEIAGLVKAAASYAFQRHTKPRDDSGKQGDAKGIQGDPKDVQVTRADMMLALDDIHPAFGVSEQELKSSSPYGIIHYSDHIRSILSAGQSSAQAVRGSEKMSLLSVLMWGPVGAGKSALAAQIGLESDFPFVKLIRPIDVGTSEGAKLEYLRRAFSDAYKSTLSVVILDSIEKIIDWNPIGLRFSNAVVQYLGALLETRPPKGRRLFIIATTSQRSMLDQHGVFNFDREIPVPSIFDFEELKHLLEQSGRLDRQTVDWTLSALQRLRGDDTKVNIGVKAVFTAIELALTREPVYETLAENLSAAIAAANP